MLCTFSCYRFENALITPLEGAAGLATDMRIILDDLFPSASSRTTMTTGLLVFALSSGPYHVDNHV